MSYKQIYNLDTLEILKTEVDKFKEKRKATLSLEQILLQHKKDILALIKSGCTAKEITNIFKAAHIKVGVAKIKQLYFLKKKNRNTTKSAKSKLLLTRNNYN